MTPEQKNAIITYLAENCPELFGFKGCDNCEIDFGCEKCKKRWEEILNEWVVGSGIRKEKLL